VRIIAGLGVFRNDLVRCFLSRKLVDNSFKSIKN